MPLIAIADHDSTDDAPSRRRAIPWGRSAVVASTTLLVGVGALLLVRRMGGALTAVPPWRQVLLAAAVAATTVWAGRAAWRRLSPMAMHAGAQLGDDLLAWSGTAALALMAIAICVPSFRLSHLIVWTPLLVVDHFLRQSFLAGGKFRLVAPEEKSAADEKLFDKTAAHAVRTTTKPVEEPFRTDESGIPPLTPPLEEGGFQTVLQQLVRVRNDAGEQSMHGTLRAEFAAGQRHAVVHLGFCPPFAWLPDVEAEPSDGPDAEVKVTQAFAHGARLEVRLAAPAEEPCAVTLEFTARV